MKRFVYLLITALLALPVAAAPPATGPVVPNFGPVMAPPADAFNLVPGTRYKVSLDVATTGDFVEDRNRMLESAARFMNMHARNGIDPKDIDFALIVHGAATRDLLTDEVYRERFGEANPNTAMLAELSAAGVQVYLCWQSASFKGFSAADFNPAVTIALSAMSAHVRLQQEGYTVIPF